MKNTKKRINVTKSYLPSMAKYQSYLQQIWTNGQLTNNGPFLKKLEIELKSFLGIKNISLLSNGCMALQLAIKALKIKGEIITTPFSYVATTNAILWEGCTPVFVDINDQSLCINAKLIEEKITKNTRAILATHVYGNPCDVKEVDRIAKKNNLKVIYDAAHAFSVKINKQSILNFGDASILSFHATKLFHTIEGGAVICKDKKNVKEANLLKSFGHIGEERYLAVGINGKMSEFQAAMGLCNLDEIEDLIFKRRKISLLYDKKLNDLINDRVIRKQDIDVCVDYNYAYYPVIFRSKALMLKAKKALEDQGIYPRRYFYPSLNKLPFINTYQSCPISEDISLRVLCLPFYDDLSDSEIKRIVRIITVSVT